MELVPVCRGAGVFFYTHRAPTHGVTPEASYSPSQSLLVQLVQSALMLWFHLAAYTSFSSPHGVYRGRLCSCLITTQLDRITSLQLVSVSIDTFTAMSHSSATMNHSSIVYPFTNYSTAPDATLIYTGSNMEVHYGQVSSNPVSHVNISIPYVYHRALNL